MNNQNSDLSQKEHQDSNPETKFDDSVKARWANLTKSHAKPDPSVYDDADDALYGAKFANDDEDISPKPSMDDLVEEDGDTVQLKEQKHPFNAHMFDQYSSKTPMIKPKENKLRTPEEMDKPTRQLYESLNSDDPSALSNFGSDLTDENVSVAIKALNNVQNKNTGEIGKQLTSLSTALKDLPSQNQNLNWFQKIFRKTKLSAYEMQAQYQSGATTINNIKKELEQNAVKLEKNNQDMEDIYHDRVKYYHAITRYIDAGQAKLDHMEKVEIPEAQKKVMSIKDPTQRFDAEQKLNDLKTGYNALSQSVSNWMASQTLTYQQVNQLNLIASSNKQLIRNINMTINTAIPVWYTEATNAIFLMTQKNANDANNAVVKATNDLIKQASAATKQQSTDIVKKSQSPIIEASTLEESYNSLISAVKDSQAILRNTNKVQAESRKRLQSINQQFQKQLTNTLKDDDTNLLNHDSSSVNNQLGWDHDDK